MHLQETGCEDVECIQLAQELTVALRRTLVFFIFCSFYSSDSVFVPLYVCGEYTNPCFNIYLCMSLTKYL
jgi:hypothetical protein